MDAKGRTYFIDWATRTSHWTPPPGYIPPPLEVVPLELENATTTLLDGRGAAEQGRLLLEPVSEGGKSLDTQIVSRSGVGGIQSLTAGASGGMMKHEGGKQVAKKESIEDIIMRTREKLPPGPPPPMCGKPLSLRLPHDVLRYDIVFEPFRCLPLLQCASNFGRP